MFNLGIQPSLRFPGGPPNLQIGHPFFNANQLSFAAVAQGPGMLDLFKGTYTTNTATKSEVNEIGPCVFGGGAAVNSSTFLSFTDARLNTSTFMVFSMIFKYIGTGQQWLMAWGTTNGSQVVASTNIINFTQSSGNIFGNYTLQQNHSYYVIVSLTVGTSAITKQYQVLDMNTGAIYTATAAAGFGAPALSVITLLQLNDALTGGPSRIAACHMSLSQVVPPITIANQPLVPSIGAIRAASSNPWSLWYGA